MSERETTVLVPPHLNHCATCTCRSPNVWHLTVYPPNELLYGRCEACRDVYWVTEGGFEHGPRLKRSKHCSCCTHPHDLGNGGHDISVPEGAGNA